MIGEYVNDDHTSVAEEMSHWDYVLYLAEQEGFISRIKGKEWYFAPLNAGGLSKRTSGFFLWA